MGAYPIGYFFIFLFNNKCTEINSYNKKTIRNEYIV